VSDEFFVEALLAEAQGSMIGAGEGMVMALAREARNHDWAVAPNSQHDTYRQAQRCREQAAAEATEARVARRRAQRAGAQGSPPTESQSANPHSDNLKPVVWEELGHLSLRELEAQALACAQQLRERELLVADAALVFIRCRGWRYLGWRSQDEYAREELGLSSSSLRAIIVRARAMIELPE